MSRTFIAPQGCACCHPAAKTQNMYSVHLCLLHRTPNHHCFRFCLTSSPFRSQSLNDAAGIKLRSFIGSPLSKAQSAAAGTDTPSSQSHFPSWTRISLSFLGPIPNDTLRRCLLCRDKSNFLEGYEARILSTMKDQNSSSNDQPSNTTSLIVLPPDLEALSLARFDDLVSKGELIYEPSTGETIEDHGFKVGGPFSKPSQTQRCSILERFVN